MRSRSRAERALGVSMKYRLFILLSIGFFFLPFARADALDLSTEIHVRSSTGGGSGGEQDSGGVIRTGSAHASVSVETNVQGEQIEKIEEQIEGEGELTVRQARELSGGGKAVVEVWLEAHASGSPAGRSVGKGASTSESADRDLERESKRENEKKLKNQHRLKEKAVVATGSPAPASAKRFWVKRVVKNIFEHALSLFGF